MMIEVSVRQGYELADGTTHRTREMYKAFVPVVANPLLLLGPANT